MPEHADPDEARAKWYREKAALATRIQRLYTGTIVGMVVQAEKSGDEEMIREAYAARDENRAMMQELEAQQWPGDVGEEEGS